LTMLNGKKYIEKCQQADAKRGFLAK
jgi:hypothetical protein